MCRRIERIGHCAGGLRSIMFAHKKRIIVFALFVLLLVFVDQFTKQAIIQNIPQNSGFVAVSGMLDIVHVRNPGAAFGLFSESISTWKSFFFIGVSILALLFIFAVVLVSPKMSSWTLGGLICFFSGALGNLIDRLRFNEVVDFLYLHIGQYYWPAFNVADAALCIGAVLFLIGHFIEARALPIEQ